MTSMKLFRTVAGILLIAALSKGLWDIGWTAAYEWHRPYVSDNVLFIAMGRAIVNGLTPYVDLFENKPPGMFVIAAVSLYFFDSSILGRLLQILAIVLIPVCTLFGGFFLNTNKQQPRERYLFLSWSFLFGVMLAVITSKWAGGFYPESFGILFSLLYVMWFLRMRHRTVTWKMQLLGGLCIAFALGFKEVFLLCFLAIALLLSLNRKEFLQKFCIPLIFALLIGTMLLLVFGYLWPYLTTYIPYLLLWHGDMMSLLNPEKTPLWQTGFPTLSLGKHLLHIAFPLPFFLLFLCIAALFHGFASKEGRRSFRVSALVLAMYLATMSGQMAGGKPHHLAVMFPFFFALFLLVSQSSLWQSAWLKPVMTFFLCAIVFLQNNQFAQADFIEERQRISLAEEVAAQIDFIMDSCDIDRYLRLIVTPIPELAFIHHSPLPTGLISTRDYNNMAIPPLNKMLSQALLDASIVLATPGFDVHGHVHRYLQEHFTLTPWPCAQHLFHLPGHLSLLFRNDRGA
ncbi:hypothetical protein A3D11_02190 [Candidatus Peribacteria bacterium RIFCSPHIGHO2_02_FULL_49_16]|nr:MAG: hypothetical protein A3D11_02190 [Candidatus Peribacteria bacterium RIFCSPHIGHO2_02_FULL_49_16]